jgi:hypothetical protein
MIIEQKIEIPASRQIFLDLPLEIPVGRAKITVTPQFDEYIVAIAFDEEAKKWYAQNDAIPIILEDYSLEKLIDRVKLAAPEMLELNKMPHKDFKLSFKIETKTALE